MRQQTQRGRLFTPEEANKALPFVRRVTEDIVAANDRAGELHARHRRFVQEGRSTQARAVEDEIRSLALELDRYFGEIEQVGCEFKDFRLGLVDFPARLGQRIVHLCWRLGEPEVEYWHEIDAGFASRQPIRGHFPAPASLSAKSL